MNSLPFPHGAAREIAEARSNGLKPAEVVLIVLAGRFNWSNPTVYATAGQPYRWDWIQGLSAVLLIDSTTRLNQTLYDIERAAPFQLDVIDVERRRGWLVNLTRPRIQAVRWPPALLDDWLESGEWHRDLHRIKSQAIQKEQAMRREVTTFTPEAVWN